MVVETPVRFGIQARLIAGIAVVASLLVILIGWYWVSHEEQELKASLVERQAHMSGLAARGFAGPIWNLDNGAINDLLDAVMAYPEVHSIEVQSVGVAAAPMRRQRQGEPVDPQRQEFDILYQTSAQTLAAPVARAVLVYTQAHVKTQLARTRLFVGSLLAAVLLAVMVTSYVLVNGLVKRPVSALAKLARDVAAGRLGARTVVERSDEIGALAAQFNAMSEQLRASSEGLRHSEERYRSLFENSTEGIFQADARGRLFSVNRRLAQMLGFHTPAQALARGTRVRSLVHIEAREYKRICAALVRHRLLEQVPILVSTHGGRQLWVELSAHIVPGDTDGAAPRIEGTLSDISLRRQAEQELTRHRDHLEELVAERTMELTRAKQRAEEANSSKSRFLATMSHEFRTPLNAILGFSQLLQMDESLGPAQQGKIALIRDSGDHLLALISDVLDMASIEAGKVRLQPVALDLRALLEVACDAVRLRAEQKRLRFEVSLDANLPARVMADGQRLRQVLLNLLSNAVKFTDGGGLSLAVRLLEHKPASARLLFQVSDTGIGMTPEQLARLFQPFEQVAEEARRHGGTGLGLSISQQLVRLMDGQLQVKSLPGRGSTFSFELELPTVA